MAKNTVKKSAVPPAAKGGPDAADIADPASAGPAPRLDESMLRFLIELAVNPEFRTKFNASPRAAINDVSPDMSEEEKQAIIDRDAAGILDIMNAIPLQNSAPMQRDVVPPDRPPASSLSRPSGATSRRRVVRVEVEFED